jgi:hypothetical protein
MTEMSDSNVPVAVVAGPGWQTRLEPNAHRRYPGRPLRLDSWRSSVRWHSGEALDNGEARMRLVATQPEFLGIS